MISNAIASLTFAPFNSSPAAKPYAPLKDRQTSPTICKNKIRRWWGRRSGVWPRSSTTPLTLNFFRWINTFDFPLQRIEILLQVDYYFRVPNAEDCYASIGGSLFSRFYCYTAPRKGKKKERLTWPPLFAQCWRECSAAQAG